ncbi:nucleoporin Nup43-like [Centruroides sculpturatus]|uniref:nucleoporin Nup43-like n=1 Tax=Centruroides sculpturatus TaxID=218467 RepID=UPI000C6D1967|nr:nucleoporin Nup43-like [Centruroides sculpturatus]
MSYGNLCVKYVSKKINKVRWCPHIKGNEENDDIFALGSWDDEANTISIWKNPKNSSDKMESDLDEDPEFIDEISHSGDVTALEFLSNELLMAASSLGSVSLYKYNQEKLEIQHTWEKIHHYCHQTASCTDITYMEDNIVSIGEDCRLICLNIKKDKQVKIIDEADSCLLTTVEHLQHKEVITGNMRGYLKLWDFRMHGSKPSRILLLTGGQSAVTCMAQHPTQWHTLGTGGEDGLLYIWDLRQDRQPITLLNAHSMAMMEIKFHPLNPDHLFTCSQDGNVCHWDATSLKSNPAGNKIKSTAAETVGEVQNPWLNCDASKHRLEIASLLKYSTLPINSLDIVNNVLLCGSDNEAVYIFPKFNL